jgi:Transposase DDE domain
MPHKHNAKKRHHIPKAKCTITNWSQYEAGLKQRGSLTLWLTPEAIAQWKAAASPHTPARGQARYSDLTIQTCLMLCTAFRIPLGQAEGLMTSSPETYGAPSFRPRHLALIHEKGRLAWQAAVGYGKRARVETMIACYKTLIGPRL